MSAPVADAELASFQTPEIADPTQAGIRARLRAICHGFTHQVIADCGGVSEETVRRYRHSGRLSALFVARLCHSLDISPDWLLLGRGSPLSDTRVGADAADATLRRLEHHLTVFREELNVAPPPGHRRTREVSMTEPPPHPRNAAERPIRLVLGPADGCELRPDIASSANILVRLIESARTVEIVDDAHPAPVGDRVLRYRRVLPTVYRWVHDDAD